MNQEKRAFEDIFSVSRETIHKLSIYEEMIISWNKKFNLVGESTLPHIWTRHFLDSAQLLSFIPNHASSLADMGSGAGFPGIVLAILTMERKISLPIYVIESVGKKVNFLQTVVDQLKLNVIVRHERIELVNDLKVDIVTARALKVLTEGLKYANRLQKEGSTCLFLKGKNLSQELTEAKKYWTFNSEIYPSRSDDSGRVLLLKNLRYKTRR